MKAKEVTKLATLLSQAERHLPAYLERTRGLSHEGKGIRRSEMFFFYASVADSKPARIVESGRARAQSTLVLSRLFPQALIVSLESDATSPDVAVAAERLRKAIQIHTRALPGENLTVTVSIGVAGAALGMPAFEAMLKRADEALYEAKRSGRNRVVRAPRTLTDKYPIAA